MTVPDDHVIHKSKVLADLEKFKNDDYTSECGMPCSCLKKFNKRCKGADGTIVLSVYKDVSSPEPDLFGFALCRVVADECELLSLAVAKSARGRGIGGGLVDVVIDQLRRMQAEDTLITKLFLEVAEDNIEAQRLYKKRGFGPIGRRPGYYHRDNGPAMAALTFAANLSD